MCSAKSAHPLCARSEADATNGEEVSLRHTNVQSDSIPLRLSHGVHWVHQGLIGKVKEVHSWQGGSPSWPRHIPRPSGSDPVPSHVRWDLWQGVAPEHHTKLVCITRSIGVAGKLTALGSWVTLAATSRSRFQSIEAHCAHITNCRSTEAPAGYLDRSRYSPLCLSRY